MSPFVELLTSRPTLIVSLPSNSLDLAKAAVQGGADALKVHIHIHHEASGTHFGDLGEERPVLEQVLALGLPTAIVIGADEEMATPEEIAEIQTMGFHAIDAYARYMPAWLLQLDGIAKMVAVGEDYVAAEAETLESLGMDLLEAAVIPATGYGRSLTIQDLVTYRILRDAVAAPIVVPTQRAIRVEEVSLLFGLCEVNALMIGAIVTGKEPGSIEHTTERYKHALADL